MATADPEPESCDRSARRQGNGSKRPSAGAGRRTSTNAAAPALSPALLPSPEGQQLRVGGEDFGHGLLKLPARIDQALYFLHPLRWDALDALLAPGHEGKKPDRMPLLVGGAVAGRLAAAAVRERKRAGQQAGRDREATEEFELALAEPGGLRPFGIDLHMHVLIHAVREKSSPASRIRR